MYQNERERGGWGLVNMNSDRHSKPGGVRNNLPPNLISSELASSNPPERQWELFIERFLHGGGREKLLERSKRVVLPSIYSDLEREKERKFQMKFSKV